MKKFEILNNFPVSFIKEVKDYYKKNEENIKDPEQYMRWAEPGDTTQVCYRMPPFNDFFNVVEKKFPEIKLKSVSFIINSPNCGLGVIHIDPDRSAVINIAIKSDSENGFFFMGDDDCKERKMTPKEMSKRTNPNAKRFEWAPEKFAIYNLNKPVILNAKKPHTFANWSDEERVLFSISLDCKYEDALEILPKEWF